MSLFKLCTVPSLVITDLTQDQPTDTSQTITITLPLTEYQPEQLVIISTASALGEDETVRANFTSPSVQYTVTFTDLDPATGYTFTIRIVLRSDNTVDVVTANNGTFTTSGVKIYGIDTSNLLKLCIPADLSYPFQRHSVNDKDLMELFPHDIILVFSSCMHANEQ